MVSYIGTNRENGVEGRFAKGSYAFGNFEKGTRGPGDDGLFTLKGEVVTMYPGMMGWGGMGWFGVLMMVVFWGIVIGGIILLVRWLGTTVGGGNRKTEDTAIEILKRRYARGEINKEEFEAKKGDLI